MKCPFCLYEDSKVVDSRLGEDGSITRRRRECFQCSRRFTTYERVLLTLPLVVKKDGRREPFDSEKLKMGLRKACEKRPVSTEQIEKVIGNIEKKLQESGEKEVKTSIVGEFVMEELRHLDKVAYVRFASVYRQFKDISEFVEEIKDISRELS